MKLRTTAICLTTAGVMLAAAAPASAAVLFDADNQTGFVGKGDVQLAYGWNNASLQANAARIDFRYEDVTTYEVTCEYFDENRTHEAGLGRKGKGKPVVSRVEATDILDITTTIVRDVTTRTRTNKHGDATGFELNGTDRTSTTGDAVPALEDSCTAVDENGAQVVGEVTDVEELPTTVGDQLLVVHTTLGSRVVWTPPVPAEGAAAEEPAQP